MKTDYNKRLRPVIRFLESNFAEPLNLDAVAELACLSPYHFHRTFKAVTGETLKEYLRRLRMQQVASDLFQNKPAIVDVALDNGFSSAQALAKAFKQYFALTPTQVRDCQNIAQYSQLMQQSKIGHVLRKRGHALNESAEYDVSELIDRRHQMTIQQFEKGYLAYVRVTGPYGENYDAASGKLYGWAGMVGLANKPCMFIYHDNPEVTPADKCRTDICLLLEEPVETPDGIEVTEFDGGKYAAFRRTISDFSEYGKAWDDAMEEVVRQGLESVNRPCFELYHSFDPATHVADVSFCTAVK